MADSTSENSKLGRAKEWLKSRFAAQPIKKHVTHHRVEKDPWYYGDGAALTILFITLVVTGSFLGLAYSASPETAYESILQISFVHTMGWFVRGIHYWSAGMMVVISLQHMFRHIILGGYQPPREGTWIIGVLLFVLIITNSYIGYTLRWDERAIYAMRISLNIFHNIPLIGDEVVRFVQGGWHIGSETLSRFFAVHVLFIPLSMFALVGYHIYLIKVYGVTTMPERENPPASAEEQIALREEIKKDRDESQLFFPYTAAKSGTYALVVMLIVVALTVLFGPAKLYPKANLSETSFPIEEWWWHWFSSLVAHLPPWLAPSFYIITPLFVLVLLLSLPFLDKGENRGARRRPLAILSVLLIVSSLFWFTSDRLRSDWLAWPNENLMPIPDEVILGDSAERGHSLFTEYGCNSCHAVGGQGSGFGPNLSDLNRSLSKQELMQIILEPPKQWAMPSYRGRLSDEELEQIADFVLAAQTFPREL